MGRPFNFGVFAMLELPCPHCKKTNKVVGFIWRDPTLVANGSDNNKVICGFCGLSFDVREDQYCIVKKTINIKG